MANGFASTRPSTLHGRSSVDPPTVPVAGVAEHLMLQPAREAWFGTFVGRWIEGVGWFSGVAECGHSGCHVGRPLRWSPLTPRSDRLHGRDGAMTRLGGPLMRGPGPVFPTGPYGGGGFWTRRTSVVSCCRLREALARCVSGVWWVLAALGLVPLWVSGLGEWRWDCPGLFRPRVSGCLNPMRARDAVGVTGSARGHWWRRLDGLSSENRCLLCPVR